ncbi:rim15, signal transduction response regulator, partial [Coemansia erecta]
MQRTHKHINIANVDHGAVATGKYVGVHPSPTRNASAILIPVEPTYLQRGSSESGRDYSPRNPLAPLYPMGSHGQARRARGPGVFSEASIAGLTSATTSPQTSISDAASANGGGQPVPTNTTALCSTADASAQVLQPAPHRRLSIIKSQELGIQRTPSKPSSGSSQYSNNPASDKAPRSTAIPQSFSGAAEKQPIVIAQLEPADRVVDTLYSFYTRLHMRLEKAKTECESELLKIIQDLGSFVEDGLCYVNEDTDPSEPDSVYGAASISETKTPSISGDDDNHDDDDDDDDTHTPGLVIARKSLSDEHRKHDLKHGATGNDSRLLFFEPEIGGSSRIYARHGLESLNGRLHDMLDHHHSRVERNSGRASSAGPDSRDAHGASTSSQLGLESVEQSGSQASLIRPLSICRLAGLVASPSGTDNSYVPSADQEHFSHSGKECWRADIRRLSRENKPAVDEATAIPEFGSYRCPLDRLNATEHGSSRMSIRSTDSRASQSASPLIEEDQFKPTPLIEAILDLVNIIGCVINLSADDMLHPISKQLLDEALERTRETGTCFDVGEECERALSMMPTDYLVQKLNSLGFMWQRPLLSLDNPNAGQKQPWPCRGLFFRALLAISSLNRIVMWYVAVRSTYSEDIIEQLDMRTHVSSSTDSQRQNVGLAYDRLSNDQAQSDTATVSGFSLVDAGSSISPGVPGPAMAYKHSTHTTTCEPNVTGTPTLASGFNLYHDESLHSPGYTISSSRNADRQVYDAGNLPPSNGATSLTLNTAELDKSLNMLLEVALDGRIRYISPTCRQLLGVDPDSVVNLPATAIFDTEDAQMCRSAVEQLLADSTRTVEINIRVHGPGSSNVADVEAKGMLIYSRTRNEPSHVLWVLRSMHSTQMINSAYSWECTSDLAENDDLMQTFEPITCRICDMSVPAAYFEKHTWLCAKSHRAAMDVCRQNDRLSDLRTEIQAWYPGCDIDDLEALVHGEIDSQALHTKAKLKAAEFGDHVWENLVSGTAEVTRSMEDICLNAIAIDEKDAVPKCELPVPTGGEGDANPSSISDNSRDFVRSHLWKNVSNYQAPLSEYTDDSLRAIQALLFDAIRAKLGAIDALQYAIVDSSVALSKWVPSESDYVDQDAHLHAEQQPPPGDQDDNAVVTSDHAESSSLQYSLPGNGRSKSGNLYPSSASPVASRASVELDATSGPEQLRIVTKDLHPTPSRSQTRSSISSNALLAIPTMPTIDDFVLLKPISKGAYGSVYLAKKRTTGEYYAIKALRKADMIAKNQISNVKAERAIMMAQTGSPFVVRLLYTFQSRTNLYLVMEYLNGGDCASLLKAIGTLPEDWARQYLAEVVLGIQDLHARNVVHRDLKPDNLLIDSEGHLKLTDFGLSRLGFLGRRVDQQTVGSPLQADETPARQTRTQEAAKAFVAGNIPSLAQPLPSATPYSIYSQGPAVSGFKSAYDEGHFGNVPSITTPPTIKTGTYHHDSAHSGHNNAHGHQVSSTYNSDTFLPTADDISGKHLPALKPVFNQSSLPDPNGGCDALSLSSTSNSSSQSVGLDPVPIPSHQKHALGTPDYIAPESILGLEAGKSVDWWALGVICYEFIFGIPPFHDDTPEKVFKNILSSDIDFYDDLRGKPELKDDVRNGCGSCFGEDEYDDGEPDVPLISPEARDFITKLLCRDPKRRLGYNGTDEVKAHPMFRGIDWDTILETQASFVPNVENIEDTDYFDPRGATMNDQESMEHLEGKPDGSGAGGALMRDTWQSAVPKPEWKIDAGSSISKSHETQFDISKYVIRAPLNRAKTLPAILGNDGIYSETNSGTVSGSQVLSPEPPSSKGGVRDLDASDGQKYRQSLSSVDAAPGSEFGV